MEIKHRITVIVKKWSTHWSVKIFEKGIKELPRVRTSSSLSHLNTIMKEENLHDSNKFFVVNQ